MANAKVAASQLSHPMNMWPLVFLFILPWSGYFHAPSSSTALVGLENLPLMFGIAFAVLAVQQLLVALAARALGDRLLMFTIGIGPKVWSRYLAHHMVIVRAIPVNSQHTLVTTRARGQRLRTALAITAGWLPFALAIAVLVAVHPTSWTAKYVLLARRLAPDTLFIYAAGWIAANGVLVTFGTLTGTQSLMKLDDSVLAARLRLGYALESEIHFEKGAYDQAIAAARRGLEQGSDDLTLQVTLAAALSAQGDPEAFEITESWSSREIPPHLRFLCQNVRAWECYVRGDDALRAEADRASLEAVSANPNNPSMLDTRGHVLLWNNRLAEAEQHLRRAFDLAKASSTRASAAAGLAILCANTKRIDDATTWLARARAQDIQNVLVTRAIALVEPLHRV